LQIGDCGFGRAQGTWRKAQGDLGQMPAASLGQGASLSFVVTGRGQKAG
jgi:hypothetical protein